MSCKENPALLWGSAVGEQWQGKHSLLKKVGPYWEMKETQIYVSHFPRNTRVSGSPEEWYNCQAKILLYSRSQQRNRTGKAATALADRRSRGLAVWLQSTQICDGKLKNSLGKEAGVASSPACFITVPRPAASSSGQNHHRETAES